MKRIYIQLNNRQTTVKLLQVLEAYTSIRWAGEELPTEYRSHTSKGGLVLNIREDKVCITQDRSYRFEIDPRFESDTDPSNIDYQSILRGVASWYKAIESSPEYGPLINEIFYYSIEDTLRYIHPEMGEQKRIHKINDIQLPKI